MSVSLTRTKKVLSDERLGAKLRVTENRCVIFNRSTYVYIYRYIYISRVNVWKKVCPERDLNPRPPITSRVWSPLHNQGNHAGNTAIEEGDSRGQGKFPGKLFFQGDRVGEPITPLETQLRIKLMMHDRSQLSRWQGRIHEGYRLIFNL